MSVTGHALAKLLPHGANMVLIDEVTAHDATRIECRSARHRDPANPLRIDGVLPALAGLEWAAQAMALHGALQRNPPGVLAHGRIASVRDVEVAAERLDQTDAPLQVRCTLEQASGTIRAYGFTVEAAGQPLLRGRMVVSVMDDNTQG